MMRRVLAGLVATFALITPARADPTIAAVGDLACPPGDTVGARDCQHRAVSDLIVRRAPARVLLAGDLQYRTGALADYRASYAPTYGRLNAIACPVPGNHEYLTAAALGFYGYFGANAFHGGRTCPVPGAPNWTIVGLDSGPDVGCSWDSWLSGNVRLSCVGQVPYLRARLAEAPTCEIAYWHHPRYTAETGDSPRVQPFLDAFYAGHGDLVINGHSHTEERFARGNPYLVRDAKGFVTWIVGTGGVSLRPFRKTPRPASLHRDDQHFGALFVTLHPRTYDARFISPDGVVRDRLLGVPCV